MSNNSATRKFDTRFSVIIPVFNAENTLARCVDSVLSQTANGEEIILVDDGSSDSSCNICDGYKNAYGNVTVIHQQNAGVSAARNKAISSAQGEFILFLDSDDYMKAGMCDKLLSIIHETKSDLVICGTEENGGNFWAPKESKTYSSLESFKADFCQHLNSELLSPVWNKIFRKSLITSLFPEGMSFGEDLVFNLNYLKNCSRISFTTECPHFHDKSNENSLVRKVDPMRLRDIESVEREVLEFSDNTKEPALYHKYLRDLSVYIRQIVYSQTLPITEKVKILKDWRTESIIENVNLINSHMNWKNTLFMIMCERKMWHSIMLLSKIKSLHNQR